jgi:hypothetical protein
VPWKRREGEKCEKWCGRLVWWRGDQRRGRNEEENMELLVRISDLEKTFLFVYLVEFSMKVKYYIGF